MTSRTTAPATGGRATRGARLRAGAFRGFGTAAAALIAALVSVLAGCAGGPSVALSDADRAAIQTARVRNVTVTQPMSYQARGAGMGVVFGIVGALAEAGARGASGPSDEATRLAAAIGPDNALIKDVAKIEFIRAANARGGIQFVDGADQAAQASLDLTIDNYGLGRTHMLASEVVPMLTLSAKVTGPDGRVLWSESQFVSALNNENGQSYTVDDLLAQPQLLRAAFERTAGIAARKISEDLPKGANAVVPPPAAAVLPGTANPASAVAGTGTATAVPTARTPAPATASSATTAATSPTTASTVVPTQPVAVRTTSTLDYEVTDRFTNKVQRLSLPIGADAAARRAFGDAGLFEPAAGWLPNPAREGGSWHASFQVSYAAITGSADLDGIVEAREQVQTRAGSFDAWRVRAKGRTERPISSTGAGMVTHRVDLTVWVDAASGQVVKSQSTVQGPSPSREVVELIALPAP